MAERRLHEIERAMEEAEREGDERRMVALREEAQAIREMLAGARHRGEEEELREMARHRAHLELERAQLEASFGRLEMVGRIAQIADSEEAAAAFAVLHVEQYMELPVAIEFLEDMFEESENETVRRMIRIRLVELSAAAERPDRVREQLLRLILGDD
jgi:hypothetical protein